MTDDEPPITYPELRDLDFERYLCALPLNAAVAGQVVADVEILFGCAG